MPLPITIRVLCVFKGATMAFINSTRPKPITVFLKQKKRLKPYGSRRLCLLFAVCDRAAVPDSPSAHGRLADRSALTEGAARPRHARWGVSGCLAAFVPGCAARLERPCWRACAVILQGSRIAYPGPGIALAWCKAGAASLIKVQTRPVRRRVSGWRPGAARMPRAARGPALPWPAAAATAPRPVAGRG